MQTSKQTNLTISAMQRHSDWWRVVIKPQWRRRDLKACGVNNFKQPSQLLRKQLWEHTQLNNKHLLSLPPSSSKITEWSSSALGFDTRGLVANHSNRFHWSLSCHTVKYKKKKKKKLYTRHLCKLLILCQDALVKSCELDKNLTKPFFGELSWYIYKKTKKTCHLI